MVAIHAHLTIAMGWMRRGILGAVDRDLVVVDTQAVALGIAIGEEAALQHLIRREADAGHHGGRVEGCLFHILEIVLRVAVQFEHAHFDQGEFLLVPDLGQVEGIVGHLLGLFFGHHLDEHLPAGEISLGDAVEQVALMAFAVLGDDRFRFLVGQVLDPLLGDAGGT